MDLAARWFHTLGPFDIGVSHFWGTGREPRLLPSLQETGAPVLVPTYDTIHQSSLDIQATTGGWLLKLEALTRSGQDDRFYATVGGFEYTFGNVRNTGMDVGLLAEYHYDSRPRLNFNGQLLAATPFDDDIFLGTRLAFNDVQSTNLLGGVIVDRNTRSTALFLEAGRRLTDYLTLDLELRSFLNTEQVDPLHSFRRDGYGEIKLSYHF